MNVVLDVGTIAILVTIIVQTSGMIWWASNVTTRIKHLEQQNSTNGDIGARISSLEVSVKSLSITLDRVYKELHQKVDKQ